MLGKGLLIKTWYGKGVKVVNERYWGLKKDDYYLKLREMFVCFLNSFSGLKVIPKGET